MAAVTPDADSTLTGADAETERLRVDAHQARSAHGVRNKAGRVLWSLAYALLFRPSPTPLFAWRRWLLRRFGATLGRAAIVHPSVRIWAPWNLEMGEAACLGPFVDCYAVARIRIGAHATVSQYSFLCGATHDYTLSNMPLTPAPITIGEGAWVAADAFVGPGVVVGEGAVVGARSSVYKDVPAWTVVAGNPARPIKPRVISA